VRVSKGGQHHDCVPPFETHRYAMLLRARFGSVHCGARDGDRARWHVELFAGTLSVVDANRFRHRAQVEDAHSISEQALAPCDDSPAAI
jgi:hypothetical protein